jgi:hypothetical protein
VAIGVTIGLLLDAIDFGLPIVCKRHRGEMAIRRTPKRTEGTTQKYAQERKSR